MSEEFEGLGLVELLDLLEPVPEPEPISMVPQTVGWVWLGVLVAALTVWLARRVIRHRRANAYRRAALAALQDAGDDPAQIAVVLRRVAVTAYSRDKVASLSGADWLAFLDSSFSGTGFRNGPGTVLASAPFTEGHHTAPGLNALARTWVEKHSVGQGT
ncbi:MAG: DUF4381 domain-containing protein [Dinoroseobacter sp.]|nr:DUF4381 domain-containing protein [Dinoroseobacter sp.]